jgi:hypothetical protein
MAINMGVVHSHLSHNAIVTGATEVLAETNTVQRSAQWMKWLGKILV